MKKRLFFAFDIEALYLDLPKEKKLIDEKNRHVTLLFLGNVEEEEILKSIKSTPLPPFKIGAVGEFDKCLFLPENNPRLVAYRVNFLEKNKDIENFQKELLSFFQNSSFDIKQENNFLPHITICRNDFDMTTWKQKFVRTPLYLKSFNLYESLGSSEYKSLWKREFIKPFEEIEHTADIAFIIKGENFQKLLVHAFSAMSFKSLDFLKYFNSLKNVDSLDDVIINLNEIITKAEIENVHLPFKAVSFHSKIEEKDNILSWEMIVDV